MNSVLPALLVLYVLVPGFLIGLVVFGLSKRPKSTNIALTWSILWVGVLAYGSLGFEAAPPLEAVVPPLIGGLLSIPAARHIVGVWRG